MNIIDSIVNQNLNANAGNKAVEPKVKQKTLEYIPFINNFFATNI